MHRRERLDKKWQLVGTPPDAFQHPDDFAKTDVDWLEIDEPLTVAACLRAAGLWSLDSPARRFDAQDWWYRARFPTPPLSSHEQLILGFEGLATVADVWLNGSPLLGSDNMFVAHESRIEGQTDKDNELFIRCRSLDQLLKAKRPRPSWRAPMIENQQLRWFRTTVLGRTPGWSPPSAAVGPWRDIWLERRGDLHTEAVRLVPSVQLETGRIEASIRVVSTERAVLALDLHLERKGKTYRTTLRRTAPDTYAGELVIEDVDLWWPHTHGEPALYETYFTARLAGTEVLTRVDAGSVGFRTITLDTEGGNFRISINGESIFCRGACWTPLDPVSLSASSAEYARAIRQVRECGMNMLRVGGTMVYESDEFLDLCDANGILLWQEFMFANMDYPEEDAAFIASVGEEARQQLGRLVHRPCLAILCGNSEVEQQAAMWGAPRERWSPKLFHEILRQLSAALCPYVPYWPSSAHGGAFPHQNNVGTTSYYGVGAYLRSPEDARRSEIKFATECLAFANIPGIPAIKSMPGGLDVKVHHPQWKSRIPRDLGAGWDFEDVRDHYLSEIFDVDPLRLRYSDHDRYVDLSRVVTGEVMAAAFKDWRRVGSKCSGALVWFLQDFWLGAGWGLVDSDGNPKAPYYYLRRALQPLTTFVTDEGCNGLFVHVLNERADTCDVTLTITLYRKNQVVGVPARKAISLGPREIMAFAEGELRDTFFDINHAYRFGPPAADLVFVRLQDANGHTLAQDFLHLPGRMLPHEADIGLTIESRPCGAGKIQLEFCTREYADTICIEVDDYRIEDNYFHLEPGGKRTVLLEPQKPTTTLRGIVRALNMNGAVRIPVPG